jgi:hypothetical protein
MSEQSPRRNNVILAFAVLAIIVAVALVPAYCRSKVEPDRRYPTAAAARASADAREWVPAFLPATATDIYERHGEGRRFVRFSADSATLAAMTAGMQRLDAAEVGKVPLPTPGWSSWWPISPRTLQGGQGKQIRVFRVDDPRDRGYLAIDPRTQRTFYWAVPAPE